MFEKYWSNNDLLNLVLPPPWPHRLPAPSSYFIPAKQAALSTPDKSLPQDLCPGCPLCSSPPSSLGSHFLDWAFLPPILKTSTLFSVIVLLTF